MATPLDIGILQNVQIIFPFLLILVVVFAALTRIQPFKDKPAFAALLAFILAIMSLFSRVVVKTINLMGPWFVLLILFAILVIIAYQSFGIEEKTILGVLTGKEYGIDFSYWMLAIVLIIGLGSLFTVLAEEKGGVPGPGTPGETGGTKLVASLNQTGGQSGAFWNTLFHPKVLGLALIFLIAMFTVQKLTKKE